MRSRNSSHVFGGQSVGCN